MADFFSALTSLYSPPITPQSCSITAWIAPSPHIIAPGHAFVQFACGDHMSSVIGFTSSIEDELSLRSLANLAGTLMNLPYKGKITSDYSLLNLCESKQISCLSSRLESTPDIIEKAWKEQKAFIKEMEESEINIHTAPSKRTIYRILDHNCVHFMSHIMDSTGITTWKQNMTYFSPPNIYEKIFNFAHHYFQSMQI